MPKNCAGGVCVPYKILTPDESVAVNRKICPGAKIIFNICNSQIGFWSGNLCSNAFRISSRCTLGTVNNLSQ